MSVRITSPSKEKRIFLSSFSRPDLGDDLNGRSSRLFHVMPHKSKWCAYPKHRSVEEERYSVLSRDDHRFTCAVTLNFLLFRPPFFPL